MEGWGQYDGEPNKERAKQGRYYDWLAQPLESQMSRHTMGQEGLLVWHDEVRGVWVNEKVEGEGV